MRNSSECVIFALSKRSNNKFYAFRAAIDDAAIILILVLIAQQFSKPVFVVGGDLIVAVVIEIWALQTNRWAYNALMPIIPVIKIGLTPTIQLAITGYLTQKLFLEKKITA